MHRVLTPVCFFEKIDPADLLSAIQTNGKPLTKELVRIAQLGLGFESFLRWAVEDIECAIASAEVDRQIRFSVSALMNSRRGLSCLADQYLLRDGFAFCKNAPRDALQKASLLVRRGLFDELAAETLSRAVDRRNRVEHNYEKVAWADVQDTVQLIRATIENTIGKSDPYWAPGFFGYFLGGHGHGPEGTKYWFSGWSGLMFVFARCESPPWFGIVMPSTETEAVVRKVPLNELCYEQLLEILTYLEAQSSPGYSGCDEQTFRGQLACAGLVA